MASRRHPRPTDLTRDPPTITARPRGSSRGGSARGAINPGEDSVTGAIGSAMTRGARARSWGLPRRLAAHPAELARSFAHLFAGAHRCLGPARSMPG